MLESTVIRHTKYHSDFAQYSLCVEDTTPGGFGSLSFATHGTLPEARGAWRRTIRDYQQDGWRRLQRIPRELRELLAARGSVLWEFVAYMARRKERALVYLIAHGAER